MRNLIPSMPPIQPYTLLATLYAVIMPSSPALVVRSHPAAVVSVSAIAICSMRPGSSLLFLWGGTLIAFRTENMLLSMSSSSSGIWRGVSIALAGARWTFGDDLDAWCTPEVV